MSIIKNGSRKCDLQEIALHIFQFCEARNVSLLPKWLPRDENTVADFLSRCYDCDDWLIKDHIFSVLDKLWGPHTVDRFSSSCNAKCKRFNSKFWCAGTEAVNCFSQCWKGEINWLVPPPISIGKTINKLVSEKASATLIVPRWISAPYWPLISKNGKFTEFCADYLHFQNDVCIAGKASKGVFNRSAHAPSFVALKIRFCSDT